MAAFPEIQIDSRNLTRSVQALIEAMGMNAENDMRRLRGESPAYGEAEFLSLTTKYNLDDAEVDELLSQSEIEFALDHFSDTKARQAAACESL